MMEGNAEQDRILEKRIDELEDLLENQFIKIYEQPKAGDILVFSSPVPMSAEAIGNVRRIINERFPGVEAMILLEGLNLNAIIREKERIEETLE